MFDLPRYAETDPMEHCPLWTGRPEIREGSKFLRQGRFEELLELVKAEFDVKLDSKITVEEILDHIFHDFGDLHMPLFDPDRDGFSGDSDGLRGKWWRGEDTSPLEADIYPGRKPQNEDRVVDSNSNGVFGVDEHGVAYERLYCDNHPPVGVAILGDSAGAHFSLPPSWFRPTEFNENTFNNLFMLLLNELDWPQLSWATGHSENCWMDDIHSFSDIQMDSIYKRLVERNRCGLNDYQNQANNGARITSMADKIVKGLSRKTSDNRMVVFLSLIGNDVCNGRFPTENSFTSAETFEEKTVETLDYLNTILPEGSTVVMTGLANGSVLWDLMNEKMHPLGEYRNNMGYPEIYEYLECLQISPCNGWMSNNATLREVTTEHAMMLSDVAEMVINRSDYSNFKALYYPFDIEESINEWEAQGGEGWQLIELVDGFHPSQTSMVLTANMFWNQIMEDYPEAFGEVNPWNDKIKEIQQKNLGYHTCDAIPEQ